MPVNPVLRTNRPLLIPNRYGRSATIGQPGDRTKFGSMDNEALLRLIRSHSTMPEGRVLEIAERFRRIVFVKGEALLSAGEVSDKYIVLTSGWLRSYTLDTEGEEVTTAFSGPGDVAFDVDSFFMRTPSTEHITALVDGAGHVLDFAELNGLFHAFPEFREMGRAILVKGFVALKQRMLTMINLTAEERYARLQRTRPELFQYAQVKHIASFLGVTDTSLSRIRKEFVRS